MNKQELLKQYPELIKEIALEAHDSINTHLACFEARLDRYIKEHTKEWEVLSFRATNGTNAIATLRDNGHYTVAHMATDPYEGYPFKYMLTKKYYEIHSVKRLSDGEVFTLGDLIYPEKPTPIVEFIIREDYAGGMQLCTNIAQKYGHAITAAVKAKAPEWEILSFVRNGNKLFRILGTDNLYHLQFTDGKIEKNAGLTSEYLLSEKGGYKIHSVKRTSDGVVFTVGDRTVKGTIKSFRIIPNGEFITDYNNGCSGIGIDHRWLEKLTPLVTTEDGVPVFEGDSLHWIINGNKGWEYVYELKIGECHVTGTGNCLVSNFHTYKVFSTREAAEKWIKENNPKPLFTTEDGVELFERDPYWFIWLRDPAEDQTTYTAYSVDGLVGEKEDGWFGVDVCVFSTKEAAENYILMNKPVLSVQNILDLHLEPTTHQKYEARIKELAKSKL